MRARLILLLLPGLLAGCAGHLADYVGSRSAIVTPQLLRFGLDLPQARCVGEYLEGTLTPRRLRLLARAASGLQQGWYEPGRLTARDFAYLASRDRKPEVGRAVARAVDTCHVPLAATVIAAAPGPGAAPAARADGVTILGPGELPPPGGGSAAPPAAAQPGGEAAARPATWLNLGAAGSGQTIAINAATIEEIGAIRSAWFRMTDPGAAGPSLDTFLLHIDCAHRTINAKARRRQAAAGAAGDYREYPDNPLPVEGGTVMEIAFLSLCT